MGLVETITIEPLKYKPIQSSKGISEPKQNILQTYFLPLNEIMCSDR